MHVFTYAHRCESEAETGYGFVIVRISTLGVLGSELEPSEAVTICQGCHRLFDHAGCLGVEALLRNLSRTKGHQADGRISVRLTCQGGRKESDELLEKKDSWLKIAELSSRKKKRNIKHLSVDRSGSLWHQLFCHLHSFATFCKLSSYVKLVGWVHAPGGCAGRFNASADWDGWSWKCWYWICRWVRWRRSSARAELLGSWCRCLGSMGSRKVPSVWSVWRYLKGTTWRHNSPSLTMQSLTLLPMPPRFYLGWSAERLRADLIFFLLLPRVLLAELLRFSLHLSRLVKLPNHFTSEVSFPWLGLWHLLAKIQCRFKDLSNLEPQIKHKIRSNDN